MAERGEALGTRPMACPFVALELDRDRRSDKPDYRHRCFAEPTPQPRAISHQAAFCLSPNFAGCPIFQDWAVRASAQPIATVGADAPAVADVVAGGAATSAAAAVSDIPPELPAPGEAWPAEAFAPVEEPDAGEQLSAFAAESPVIAPAESPVIPPPESGRFFSSEPPEPDRSAPVGAFVKPDEAPVPGFLAGRPPRPARSSRPPELEPVAREDLIPSWERDGRYGAEPAERERTDRFGGIVTAIAVIAILGLGVAGVIFLPGILAGGSPTRTASPTLTAAPPDGAVLPTATVGPVATVSPSPTPGVSAGPTPTPHIYTVKKGDSISRIANKFHITNDELLAANPQVTNPDRIQPGDRLTIPPPST